jgi:hypothetical protein
MKYEMWKKGKVILGFIQLFVAIGAIPAGYLFISEPDGSKMGMSLEALAGSPFKNFFIPGLFLFSVNGVFNLVCSALSFLKYKYASVFGIGLGFALLIWVSVQVYSIGLTHFLQPAYFVIGIVEIVLSIYIIKNEKIDKIK